jgi:hypothetical protein
MKTNDILAQKYQDIFDLTQRTIEESLNFIIGEKANSLKRQVTLFHYIRAAYLIEAIYCLSSQGLATESMVLLRSLLNLYINIKWLAKDDSQERFERYADFEVIFKKIAIDTLLEHGEIWNEIKKPDFNTHDNDFERVKNKYNLKNPNDFFNWSGKTIYQMAKDENVNLEKEYKIIYGRLSSVEHTRPDSVRDYLDSSENGITKIKSAVRDENIDRVLLTALQYYFQIKVITHNIFSVEWPNLRSLENEFSNLQRKYWENSEEKV